ncbi:MAG: phage holin family protein [Candidatus Obscuribacterales bacterium]|nr:phage holin family protein [Candidatus Obscuribacterales bacterium]
MLRFIVRVLLTALLFCFIFPKIAGGVQFHGQFWPDGLIYAGVFAIVAHLVNFVIRFALAAFSVATLGLGLLIVIPSVLFGFWLLPAIQLQVFAHFFPEQFTVSGWGSAIWGGLLLMIVNTITATVSSTKSSTESRAK